MYLSELDFISAEYRSKEMIKQVEHERLIRIAQRNSYDQAPIHQRLLLSLGTWLEYLGRRLKSQYVEIADLETQHSTLS